MCNSHKSFEVKSWGPHRILWLESDRLQECIDFYYENHLDGIGISPYQGYDHDSLDFLRDYPDLRGIILVYADKFDLSPIEVLKSLRFITLSGYSKSFDFSQFPNIEDLRVEWHKTITLPKSSQNLRSLYLRKYDPASKSCVELPELPHLETLELVQSTITSLDGISRFTNLKRLCISYCSQLVDVDCIGSLELNELEFETCKKAKISQCIEKVGSVRSLKISDCGKLPTVSFLKKMPHIERFSFVDTNIEDGDLSPCLKLQSVGFTDKKHYSHKYQEVQRILKKQK